MKVQRELDSPQGSAHAPGEILRSPGPAHSAWRAAYVPMKYFQTQVSIPAGNAGAQAWIEAIVNNVWTHP